MSSRISRVLCGIRLKLSIKRLHLYRRPIPSHPSHQKKQENKDKNTNTLVSQGISLSFSLVSCQMKTAITPCRSTGENRRCNVKSGPDTLKAARQAVNSARKPGFKSRSVSYQLCDPASNESHPYASRFPPNMRW